MIEDYKDKTNKGFFMKGYNNSIYKIELLILMLQLKFI